MQGADKLIAKAARRPRRGIVSNEERLMMAI